MRQPQSRIAILCVFLSGIFQVITADQVVLAASPEAKTDSVKTPVLNLTSVERKFLRATEKQLVTKFNSKDNPGDRDTWYALLFRDEVVAQSLGASSSGSQRSVTVATMVAVKPDGVVVQGKEQAALAVARFMFGANRAANGLPALSTGESRSTTQAAGNKRWSGESFRTKTEAQAWLARMLPPKLSTPKAGVKK